MTKLSKSNVAELVARNLTENETEFHYARMAERLIGNGVEIASKTPGNSLNLAIKSSGAFKALGKGMYALKSDAENISESNEDSMTDADEDRIAQLIANKINGSEDHGKEIDFNSVSIFESDADADEDNVSDETPKSDPVVPMAVKSTPKTTIKTDPKPNLNLTSDSLLTGAGIPSDVINEVDKRFRILERTIDFVASGCCNGAVVGGSAGVGKSHTVFKRLEMANKLAAMQKGGKKSIIEVRNKITPRQLFNMLYEYKEVGNVICLDDCDSVLYDETGINILKSATEMKEKRTVSYYTAGSFGNAQYDDTPPSFTFEGAVVVISNIDFVKESQKNTKIAPHFKALLDRSQVINVGCYDETERFARIHTVVSKSNIFEDMDLTDEDAGIVMDAVISHRHELRDISIRTIESAAMIYASYHTHTLPGEIDPEWIDHMLHVRGNQQ